MSEPRSWCLSHALGCSDQAKDHALLSHNAYVGGEVGGRREEETTPKALSQHLVQHNHTALSHGLSFPETDGEKLHVCPGLLVFISSSKKRWPNLQSVCKVEITVPRFLH